MTFKRQGTIFLLLMLGLMFLSGRGILIGVEGIEPILIPIPVIPVVGYVLIWFALFYCIPPFITVKIWKYFRNIFIGRKKEKKTYLSRIEEASK